MMEGCVPVTLEALLQGRAPSALPGRFLLLISFGDEVPVYCWKIQVMEHAGC